MARASKEKLLTTAALVGVFALGGCKTTQESDPAQTATEQMLLASAADAAIAKINPNVPEHNAIYVDNSNFIEDADYRTQYSLNRIRSRLLALNYRLVDARDKADTVAEVSSGVQSVDKSDNMFAGIPSLPIPFTASGTDTPEVPLFKRQNQVGVASFNIAFYDAETGERQDVVGPIYGFSHAGKTAVLNLEWENQDLLNKQQRREQKGRILPEMLDKSQ